MTTTRVNAQVCASPLLESKIYHNCTKDVRTMMMGSPPLRARNEKCLICWEDASDAKPLIALPGCRHGCCATCWRDWIRARVEQGSRPACPYCGHKLTISEMTTFVTVQELLCAFLAFTLAAFLFLVLLFGVVVPVAFYGLEICVIYSSWIISEFLKHTGYIIYSALLWICRFPRRLCLRGVVALLRLLRGLAVQALDDLILIVLQFASEE